MTESDDTGLALHHDDALLARFRAGDAEVLTTVYRAYVREVFAIASRGFTYLKGDTRHVFAGVRLPYEQRAIVQEVFRRAFAERARLGYRGDRPYGAYLGAIARNLMLNLASRGVRGGSIETVPGRRVVTDHGKLIEQGLARAAGQFHAEAAEPPDEKLMRRELHAVIEEFLETCAPESRALVELRYLEGLPQREAAERLAITRSMLRRREAELKPRLRAFLERRGYGDEFG